MHIYIHKQQGFWTAGIFMLFVLILFGLSQWQKQWIPHTPISHNKQSQNLCQQRQQDSLKFNHQWFHKTLCSAQDAPLNVRNRIFCFAHHQHRLILYCLDFLKDYEYVS